MEVLDINGSEQSATLVLSLRELGGIRAALNEALSVVPAWEFPARVVFEREDADELHMALSKVISRLVDMSDLPHEN